jgi:hypothetical protein
MNKSKMDKLASYASKSFENNLSSLDVQKSQIIPPQTSFIDPYKFIDQYIKISKIQTNL